MVKTRPKSRAGRKRAAKSNIARSVPKTRVNGPVGPKHAISRAQQARIVCAFSFDPILEVVSLKSGVGRTIILLDTESGALPRCTGPVRYQL